MENKPAIPVSPQIENGFTRIANEVLEAIARTKLSGYEIRYLAVLWRMTYGWGQKEAWISNSRFVEATGIHKGHIARTQRALISRNIVTKNGNKLSFQKEYTRWNQLPKMVTAKSRGRVTIPGLRVTKNGNKSLPPEAYIKERKKQTKENSLSDSGSEARVVLPQEAKKTEPKGPVTPAEILALARKYQCFTEQIDSHLKRIHFEESKGKKIENIRSYLESILLARYGKRL